MSIETGKIGKTKISTLAKAPQAEAGPKIRKRDVGLNARSGLGSAIGSKGTSVHRFLTAYGDLVAVSTPYGAGLEFFWFGKPVRSEIFVVKILGTGVALEIDDGSVAKVILK